MTNAYIIYAGPWAPVCTSACALLRGHHPRPKSSPHRQRFSYDTEGGNDSSSLSNWNLKLKLNSSLAWTVTSHQYFKIALFFCIVYCRLKRKKKETVGVCLELFMHKYMAHPALQSMGSHQTKVWQKPAMDLSLLLMLNTSTREGFIQRCTENGSQFAHHHTTIPFILFWAN